MVSPSGKLLGLIAYFHCEPGGATYSVKLAQYAAWIQALIPHPSALSAAEVMRRAKESSRGQEWGCVHSQQQPAALFGGFFGAVGRLLRPERRRPIE